MKRRGLPVVFGALITLSACGGQGQPPKPVAAPAQPPSSATPPTAQGASAGAAVAAQPGQPSAISTPAAAARAMARVLAPPRPRYDAKGRRDPFENLETQAKEREKAGGFMVAATRLTGIIRGSTTMALVETPDGVGYILKPGDTLGDGRLLEIGTNSAVFAVPPKPGSTTNRVVLTITTD
jgi:hypothetical protein